MTAALIEPSQRQALQALYREMAPEHLTPLWEVLNDLVTPEPRPSVVAHRWQYASARAHLMRAGELISAAQAERRVVILENPALPGRSAVTSTLYAGLQLILPGEVAACHRHTQSAMRFVLEGEGAYTAVDGEKAVMRAFDLVLTPGWQWHDHGNPSSAPMIWLDALDIPTVRFYEAGFAERLPSPVHPETAPPGATSAAYGHNLRPLRGSAADRRPAHQPLFHYPYEAWRAALEAMAASAPIDPHVGYALEFRNPADGGPVLPTMSAHVRLLPAGFRSRARRTSDGTVFVVVDGAGEARVGDATFALAPRDLFVVPPWQPTEIRADRDLVLFAYSDQAAQQSLGLYREQNS